MSKTILFQGDSITDCERPRNSFGGMGSGYPYLVKAELGAAEPLKYEFINRGVSGNRIVDLYARIKADFINLSPDYASILIGVNDAWHEIDRKCGVDTAKFEKIYTMLLDELFEACPDLKLIIMSPYLLNGGATCNTEQKPNRFELLKADVGEKAEVSKRIAAKYGLPLIDLQAAFDNALKTAPASYWSEDGVHPTVYGHTLIKDLWIDTFKRI